MAGIASPPDTEDALLAALNQKNLAALCLSGGGIRSASFALGLLQALAGLPRGANSAPAPEEQSLLFRFNYLSTVSGGGYIGAWLTAMLHRNGAPATHEALTRASPETHPEADRSRFLKGLPVEWVRAYANFITPKRGLFSVDTWHGFAIILRNMLLTWLIALPSFVMAVIGVIVAAVVIALARSIAVPVHWPALDFEPTHMVSIALAAVGLSLHVWGACYVLSAISDIETSGR
ncbi:MAG TPA: patatin-like phospholipase family protein, partial [Hyphomicrobiaceae bacterium]|nr:patatin-like phospholipase family protein [Hyphomicrobiaceae bacterium]